MLGIRCVLKPIVSSATLLRLNVKWHQVEHMTALYSLKSDQTVNTIIIMFLTNPSLQSLNWRQECQSFNLKKTLLEEHWITRWWMIWSTNKVLLMTILEIHLNCMMLPTFSFNSKSSLLSFLCRLSTIVQLGNLPGCVDSGTNFEWLSL